MSEKLIKIGGQLTDVDGQNGLVVIGDHRITGLDRDCLKALAQHLYDPVVITVSKFVESAND